MAENESIKHIESDVKAIRSSKFGRKLPSRQNESLTEEQLTKSLSYDQMIMGTLASLVWGKANIKKDDQVKSLLGNNNNLFTIVENIRDANKTFYGENKTLQSYINQITDAISKSNKNVIASENEQSSVSNIIIDIPNNIKELSELINTLGNNKQLQNSIFVGLNSIVELLNSLSSSDFKLLSENAQENLREFSKIIADEQNKDSLRDIITNINNIVGNKSINVNLHGLSSIIDTIIKIISIDPKAINVKGLELLFDITKTNGLIASLISNLHEITKDKNANEKPLRALSEFFNALTLIADIGFIQRRRIRNNISFIKRHIIGMIPEIVEELEKVVMENDDGSRKALYALSSFFSALTSISDLDIKKKFRLLYNLFWIKTFYIEEIIDILNELQSIVNSNGESTSKALQGLSTLFNDLIKIGDLNFRKILAIAIKVDMLKDIIEVNILDLLSAIKNLSTSNANDNIISILNLFKYVDSLYDSTPSIIDSALELLKLKLLHLNIISLDKIVNEINKINSIKNVNDFNPEQGSIPITINSIKNLLGTAHDKTIDDLKLINESLIYFNDSIIEQLILMINGINSIPQLTKRGGWITALKKILYEFNESGGKNDEETIGSMLVYLPSKDKLKEFLAVGTTLKVFSASIISLELIKEERANEILESIKQIKNIIKEFNTSEDTTLASQFNKINLNNFDKIDNIIKVLQKLSNIGKIKLILNISQKTMDNMAYLANPLKKFIETLANIKKDDVEKAKDIINTYFKVVIMGAAILLGAGIIMKRVNIVALAAFTLLLSVFLLSISATLKIISKAINADFKIARDAFTLVALCGGIMLLGALISSKINLENLIGFTLMLSTFLLAVSLTLIIFSFGVKQALKGAKDAIILIGGCALIMILGSFIYRILDPKDVYGFTILLGTFLFAIGLVFTMFNIGFRAAMKGAKDAAILITTASIILILGSFIYRILKWKDVLGFTLMLSVFLASILLIFKLAAGQLKDTMKTAIGLSILLVVCTTILLIGSWFMQDIGRILGAIAFIVLMNYFVGGIIAIFSIAGDSLKSSMMNVITIGIITFIMSAILLGSAAILMNYPMIAVWSLVFILLFGAFSFILISVLKAISKEQKAVWTGIGILVAVGFVTVLMAFALEKAAHASNLINDWKTFAITVGIMTGVIWALVAMAVGIGMAGPEAVGYIAAGAAILAGIVGIIWLLGQAVVSIAEGLEAIAKVSKMEITENDLWNLAKLLFGFGLLVAPMMQLSGMLPIIGLGAVAMLAMKSFLYDAADIIQKYAVLHIPMIDEKGNEIGVKILSESDMKKALDNMKTISSMPFDVINYIHETHSDMFSWSGAGKLASVLLGIKGVSIALSSIASTVKEWIDLKIPIYDGTKIVGYHTIESQEFAQAGENIQAVVTCLAQAILDVYDNAPDKDMFEPAALGIFGPSKFSKVTRAIGTMGESLESVAEGIVKWADLKIPVYKNGKIVNYKTITDEAFKTAAANISYVVTFLGLTILGIYKSAQEVEATKHMFDSKTILGVEINESPFSKVVRSMSAMGQMLSSVADGIIKWTDLKIPVYKNGQVVDYQTLTTAKMDTAAQNIKDVLSAMGNAIIETVEGHEKIFGIATGDSNKKDIIDQFLSFTPIGGAVQLGSSLIDSMKDSPVIIAAKAIKIMSEALSLSAETVAYYAAGKFPVYDGKGNPLPQDKWLTIKTGTLTDAGTHIQKVLECIGQSLITVIEKDTKGIFKDGEDSPALIAANSIKTLTEGISEAIKIIKGLSELDLDTVLKGLDPNGKNNVFTKLNSLLEFTSNIFTLFIANDPKYSKLVKKHQTRTRWYWFDKKDVNMSFAEYLDEHNKDIEKANESLTKFTKLLTDLVTKFKDIGKTFIENKQALGIFVPTSTPPANNSEIYKYLLNSMRTVIDIMVLLTNNKYEQWYDYLNDNSEKLKEGLSNSITLIDTLLNGLAGFKDNYDKIKGFKLGDSITPFITDFQSAIDALVNTNIDENNNTVFKLKLPVLDENLKSNLETYVKSLNDIINVAVNAVEKRESREGYNVLKDGILTIYSATSKVTSTTNFKNHAADLKNYVKTINGIQLNKIKTLTAFVQAVNELSKRLGNIDKLTNVIAKQLSSVLIELVAQLRMADISIKNAHALQEKRKKLIDDSINTIKTIMNQHMIVEIKQAEEGADDDGDKKQYPITSTPPNTPPAEDANDVQQQYGPTLESVENTKENQKIIQPWQTTQSKANEDYLSTSYFKSFMEQFMNDIKNNQ